MNPNSFQRAVLLFLLTFTGLLAVALGLAALAPGSAMTQDDAAAPQQQEAGAVAGRQGTDEIHHTGAPPDGSPSTHSIR